MYNTPEIRQLLVKFATEGVTVEGLKEYERLFWVQHMKEKLEEVRRAGIEQDEVIIQRLK